MALMMGRPWIPPQRAIAQVAGELREDGHYAYDTVVVTMPRQSAKSTTVYDVALGRGRLYQDFRAKYSTHKGTITSDRFADWFLELERVPAVVPGLKLRRSRGTEAIGWRRTGSYWQAFPAKDGALRSAALDLVVVDEAQEHDDALGKALDRTIIPTFTTRPRRQLWVVFTAGTDASAYAADYLRRAIAGEPGLAVFDYGCPEDVDPLEESLWPTWHPGLAYGLTDVDALRMALRQGTAAFIREYGNTWTRTTAGRVVPEDEWRRIQRTADMPAGRVAFGADVSFDRTTVAVAVAGAGHVELDAVLDFDLDTVVAYVAGLCSRHGAPVVVDDRGPSATLHDALTRHDVSVVTPTAYDVAVAAGAFLDAVRNGTMSVWPHPALDDAVQAAGTRPLGDGFAWSRRHSAASIAPLVAVTAALWGSTHLPPVPRAPVAAIGTRG